MILFILPRPFVGVHYFYHDDFVGVHYYDHIGVQVCLDRSDTVRPDFQSRPMFRKQVPFFGFCTCQLGSEIR